MIVWGIAQYVEHKRTGDKWQETAWEIQVTGRISFLATTPELSLKAMREAADVSFEITEEITLPFRGHVEGFTARLMRVKWVAGEEWQLLYPLELSGETASAPPPAPLSRIEALQTLSQMS